MSQHLRLGDVVVANVRNGRRMVQLRGTVTKVDGSHVEITYRDVGGKRCAVSVPTSTLQQGSRQWYRTGKSCMPSRVSAPKDESAASAPGTVTASADEDENYWHVVI